MLGHLLQQSNVLGFGNVLVDVLNSEKYGVPWLVQPLGPGVSKVYSLGEAMISFIGSGKPARLANWISKNLPIISATSYDSPVRAGIREGIKDILD